MLQKPLTDKQQGAAYILGISLIEGWFPILAALSFNLIGSLYSYFFSLLFATIVLMGFAIVQRKMHEFLCAAAYKDVLLTSFFITSLFALIFLALQYTSPGQVNLILFLQVLFSYLFFQRLKEERVEGTTRIGIVLMTLGAIFVLFPLNWQFNTGDLLVLLAAIIAPFANFYQKRARKRISSVSLLSMRTLIALPFIGVLAWWFNADLNTEKLQQAWIWLVLTGVLVFAFAKIWWVEALHRMPITQLNAMVAISPVLTLVFSYWVFGDLPNLLQMLGILPILLGGFLILQPPKKESSNVKG